MVGHYLSVIRYLMGYDTPGHFVIRFDLFIDADLPLAGERKKGDGSWTFRQNFSGWWSALIVLFPFVVQCLTFMLSRRFQGRPTEEGHDMDA